jgi:hypothetical protein
VRLGHQFLRDQPGRPGGCDSAPIRLSKTNKVVATLGAGQTLTRRATIALACTSSSRAGETLATQVTFSVSL